MEGERGMDLRRPRWMGGARVPETAFIVWGCDEIRPIGDGRSVIVGLFGLKWAYFISSLLNIFLFPFHFVTPL